MSSVHRRLWNEKMKMNVPVCLRLTNVATILVMGGLALTAVGCAQNSDNAKSGAVKLKVAYLGLTCEAPIFVAYEKGFYKEEGLDVELVKTDWDGLREGLGLGRFDANHTLIMYLLKPIEQGMDVKITGGVHTGCLRLQVSAKAGIKTVKDLKGKRIGIPTHIGSPPYLFACRVLVANGIDPNPEKKEITWLTFAPDVLGKAVAEGRVDAVATSDPIGTILEDKGLTRTIADQAVDAPYCDEYCCAAVVSGKLANENPVAAAKVTRAILKGARWVEENSSAAGRLAVDKKYTAASAEINAQALAKLKYLPGVSKCRESIELAAKEMQRAGLLKPHTDPTQLTKRAWLDLDGVTDQWLSDVKVAKVDRGRRRPLEPAEFAALARTGKVGRSCCSIKQ